MCMRRSAGPDVTFSNPLPGPAAPDVPVRARHDDIQHEGAGLILDDPALAVLVVAVPVSTLCLADVDALVDAGVVVNQQIGRRRRRPLESFGGQLLFDRA